MRILIVEDSVLLREGLTRLLADAGHEVVAALPDATDVTSAVARTVPDLCIVDVRLPPTFRDEGIRAALELRRRDANLAVLVFSQYVEEQYASDLIAQQGGAVGYLLKDRVTDVAEFLESIDRIAEGATVLDPEVVAQLLTRRSRDEKMQRLTERERTVLSLIAEGKNNAGISKVLFISAGAVEKHIASDLPEARPGSGRPGQPPRAGGARAHRGDGGTDPRGTAGTTHRRTAPDGNELMTNLTPPPADGGEQQNTGPVGGAPGSNTAGQDAQGAAGQPAGTWQSAGAGGPVPPDAPAGPGQTAGAGAPEPGQSDAARLGTRAVAITATVIGAASLLFAGTGAAFSAVNETLYVAQTQDQGADGVISLDASAAGVTDVDIDHSFGSMRVRFDDVTRAELEATGMNSEWRLEREGDTLMVRRNVDGLGWGDWSWFGSGLGQRPPCHADAA